jgi:glycosyltransferase 2 family protein
MHDTQGEAELVRRRSMRIRSSWSILVFKIALSALLLVGTLRHVDLGLFLKVVRSIPVNALLLILMLALAQVLVTSLRWYLMLASLGYRLPPLKIFRINIYSLLANTLLLNTIGGMITRVYLLRRDAVPSHSVLSTTLMEKLLVVFVLALMTAGGLYSLRLAVGAHAPSHLRMLIAGFLCVTSLGALALIASAQLRQWARRGLHYCMKMIEVARELARNPPALATAFVLTVSSQILLLAVGATAAANLHLAVPVARVVLLLPATMLLAGLPISIGGFGVREASAVLLLGLLGVSPEKALTISLAIAFSAIFGIIVAAAMVLPTYRPSERRADSLP